MDEVKIEAMTPDGKLHAWVVAKPTGGIRLETWRWTDATYTVHNDSEQLVAVAVQRQKGEEFETVGLVAPGKEFTCS